MYVDQGVLCDVHEHRNGAGPSNGEGPGEISMSSSQASNKRARRGALSAFLRACSALAAPQCEGRITQAMLFVLSPSAAFIGCSGTSTQAATTGGTSGNAGHSSTLSELGGTSHVDTTAGMGGSYAQDTSTGDPADTCSAEGQICQMVWCCGNMNCVGGFCRAATGGSFSTGGASSTGGNESTGGALAVCGNGILEGGETCDPPSSCPTTCPGENACNIAERTGSAVTCVSGA